MFSGKHYNCHTTTVFLTDEFDIESFQKEDNAFPTVSLQQFVQNIHEKIKMQSKNVFQSLVSISAAVWPETNRQMSIRVAQKWVHLKNDRLFTPLQKLPKNVGDFGKLIVAKGFKKWPKVQ